MCGGIFMKYNSIGQQLIAKAKELDPSYQSDSSMT